MSLAMHHGKQICIIEQMMEEIWVLHKKQSLFILALVVSNVEVPKLIHPAMYSTAQHLLTSEFKRGKISDILPPVLVWCNHSKPVPHIVLLEVLLCQILKIPVQSTVIAATRENYRNSRLNSEIDMAEVYLFDIGSSVVTDSFVLSFWILIDSPSTPVHITKSA